MADLDVMVGTLSGSELTESGSGGVANGRSAVGTGAGQAGPDSALPVGIDDSRRLLSTTARAAHPV